MDSWMNLWYGGRRQVIRAEGGNPESMQSQALSSDYFPRYTPDPHSTTLRG